MMELIKILIDNLQNPPLCTSIMESEIASHIEAPLWRDLWHDLLEDLREGADAAILIEGVLDALIPTPQSKQLMAESLLKSPPVDPETSSLMLSQIQQTFVRLKLERKIRQLTQEIRQASREDEQDVEALIREKIALQMQLPRYQAPVIEDNKQSSISFHNP